MGSLFEGPEVTSPEARGALRGLDKTSKKIRKNLRPVGFDAGGLSATFKNNSVQLGSSAERRGLVSSISDRFLEQAGLTRGLRDRVAPGLSDLRRVRLQEIEDSRRGAISNLRDNLARRRVLGSSFAADAEARTEIEFARDRERVAAESFLQEIDLTNQFISQEFDLSRQAFATQIGELNFQADIATKLTAQATETLVASAQLQSQLAIAKANATTNLGIAQAELDAKAQAGAGSLIGLGASFLV